MTVQAVQWMGQRVPSASRHTRTEPSPSAITGLLSRSTPTAIALSDWLLVLDYARYVPRFGVLVRVSAVQAAALHAIADGSRSFLLTGIAVAESERL